MGAQAQGIYAALSYSYTYKVKYLHTPIRRADHNDKNVENWENLIENFFGLEVGEERNEKFTGRTVMLDNNISVIGYLILSLFSRQKVLFVKGNYHQFANSNPDSYNLIRDKLRTKFWHQKKEFRVHGQEKKLVIAYHIRRGDVGAGNSERRRFTSNKTIVNQLTNLSSFLNSGDIPFDIHIYSEGQEKEFESISDFGTLHLENDPFEDIFNMVKADIFFMAKSSFSYSAALISSGIIIYEPFWHKPLNNWFINKEDMFSDSEIQKVIKLASAKKLQES